MKATPPTVLRYVAGRFRLEHPPASLRAILRSGLWEACPGGASYYTTHLRAAAALRRYGDPGVQKIFKRAFQSHYPPVSSPLPKGFVDRLDYHQVRGLEWILDRKRSYLAHAPGAGKTAQAILAACLAKGPGQSFFIVPPALTLNWEREIWKFTEWLGIFPTIGIVPNTARKSRMDWSADFIICPDSMLTKDWVYARLQATRKKFIAVDEASRFKDPLAERSLAFYGGRSHDVNYPGLFQDARHVVFLDGSPMPNRPIELWAPTYALHPEAIDCMDRDDFGYRYCGAKPNERGVWEYLYSSHEAELQSKLTDDFMHVVTEDKLSHPERRRSMVFVNEDVRTLEHKTWERRHLGGLLKGIESGGEEVSQGDAARMRREIGERKVPWVARYVRERLDDKNESILLFAWHRGVCEALAAALDNYKPGVIMGGTKATIREKLFAEFQRGRRKLLILNIAAGGRGHNLQRADRVIFAEYSWTDEMNKQCEKRASRRGNDRAMVRCEYAVAPGSMDERVLKSVFTKEQRVKRIIG